MNTLYRQKSQIEQLHQFIVNAINFFVQGQQPKAYGIFKAVVSIQELIFLFKK